MTEKFKYVKIVSFVALVMAIIVLLSAVITPNGTNAGIEKYEKAKIWLSEEPENTIDAVFLGDSEVYSVISPLELWNDYGYATYNCSSGAIKGYQCYDLLYTMLERQNPKIVFIECNFLYRDYDEMDDIYSKIGENLPLFKYHDVWKSYINPDQEYEKTDNYTFKGYVYYNKVKAAKNKNYMVETDKASDIAKAPKSYFDKMYKLCQDKGIEVVLISTPSAKNWNYWKHNGIAKLAKEYNLEYMDLNLIDEVGIDWQKDTRDKGDHVNHSGAVKVTKYLGEYLEKRDILEDHRGDDAYADWDALYEKYLDKINSSNKKK